MTGLPASLRAARPPRKPAGTAALGFGQTSRLDAWWVAPLGVGFWLAVLVLYSFFSALVWKPALRDRRTRSTATSSPFFAPFFANAPLPTWLSPAILTLWIPIGFRITCYYFRRAYYRAYLADPPACAVGEPTDPPPLPDGDGPPVHPPEPAPVLPVPRGDPAGHPLGRGRRLVRARTDGFADRPRQPDPGRPTSCC